MKQTTAFAISFTLLAGAWSSPVCFAQSADQSLVECTQVADSNARLRCYDDRMMRLGHKVGVETAAAPKPTPTVAATTPSPPQGVGTPAVSLEQAEFGASPELLRKQRAAAGLADDDSRRELTARVKSVSERAHGEFRIELDNDQVWVETQHSAISWRPVAGETVTIKHGSLGSFFLTGPSGPAMRVKRIL
jgi:hypothetical protein